MRFRDLNKRKVAEERTEKHMQAPRLNEEDIIKQRDEARESKNEQKKIKRLLFISGSVAERLRMLRLGEEIGVSFHAVSDLKEIADEKRKIDLNFEAIIISDEVFEKIDVLCASDFIGRLKEIYERHSVKFPKVVLLTDFTQRFEKIRLHLRIDHVQDYTFKKFLKKEHLEEIIKTLEEER